MLKIAEHIFCGSASGKSDIAERVLNAKIKPKIIKKYFQSKLTFIDILLGKNITQMIMQPTTLIRKWPIDLRLGR
jgi:hypothetical protein